MSNIEIPMFQSFNWNLGDYFLTVNEWKADDDDEVDSNNHKLGGLRFILL